MGLPAGQSVGVSLGVSIVTVDTCTVYTNDI